MPGMILKEDIEKVRATADLYDIVSATVTLKPSGTGTYVGLCPFHDEKTPSFSVRPALGVWHCFGCGLGGDVFGYVEHQENVDFRDAVELLADRYHIELRYDQSNAKKEHTGSKRARLLEANEAAQEFFVSQLMTKDALAARKLLDGRNFSQADCQRFGCGYAPQGWDNLVRYLAGKGFTQQEMLDAGLARQGQHGVYDYFRGRVTWPIRDSTGRTLGFGARKLYEDDSISAKYINTPDTQLYRKNQVLYGIDMAKSAIVKKRQAVIVEGYTDVMAMHLAGIDTAIATCGTAFGAEHAKIVRRLIADDSLGAVQLVGPLKVEGQALSSRIVFTFDGDAAGQKAAIHAFGLDSAFSTQAFVAVADDNLDPCDLRIKRGNEAVRALIDHAEPLYDFVIKTAIGRFDTTYTTGQMGAVKAVAPLIAQIRDRSLLDLYSRKAVRQIGVDLDIMQREVRDARRKLQVRDEDAYAPKRRFAGNAGAAVEPRMEQGTNPYANPPARKAVEHRDVYELQENMPYREMAALIRMSGAELGKLGSQSDNPDELRSEEESKALEAEIRKFLNSFDWVNASDYEKAVRIARRVNQAEYSNTTENCSYAYGCLVEGKASCSGMTGASEVLAMCVNLPVASVVLGFAAHAYPIYCIDGVWFEHEPTSDSTLFKEFYPEDVLQKAGNSIIYLPIYAYCERTGYVAPTNEELEKKFPYNPYRTNARFILAWR